VRVTVVAGFPRYRPFKQTNIYRMAVPVHQGGRSGGFANGFIDSARTVTTVGVSLPSLAWVPPPIPLVQPRGCGERLVRSALPQRAVHE
jgi:hypothetical protein